MKNFLKSYRALFSKKMIRVMYLFDLKLFLVLPKHFMGLRGVFITAVSKGN
jgi:hypothetical protein